jgi:anti-sigma regulatory factor (Ser/Thr protein kinase)
VAAESDDSVVTITVNDDGPGIGPDQIGGMPDPEVENGRGMEIMRVTTDAFELRQHNNGGVSVRLRKRLRWCDGAIGGVTGSRWPAAVRITPLPLTTLSG